MSQSTEIQWTDATWNPTTGCTKVSPGCANCYIERTPPFRIHGRKFVNGSTDMRIYRDRLDWPFKWKTPQRVFVNSLSDLFHDAIPFEFIADVFTTMAQTPHTYQLLTKRPERLLEFYRWNYRGMSEAAAEADWLGSWPRVWFGVSVENQHWRSRIDVLRLVPAITRFLSCEPLLEDLGTLNLDGIHQVIVGGESGPKARPCSVGWIRQIVRQCEAAGVAAFVKQLGHVPTQPVIYGPLDFTGRQELHHEPLRLIDKKKGGDMAEWPEDLRVREFPR